MKLDNSALILYSIGINTYICVFCKGRVRLFRLSAQASMRDAHSFNQLRRVLRACGDGRWRNGMYCLIIMPVDLEPYRPYVDRFDLTEEEKAELVETVEAIMDCFADWAFGLDPVQQALSVKDICKDDIEEIESNDDH